jgi:hypothetical protein
MIDTLKLSNRLQEASMSKDQADAIAEGIAEGIADAYVTKQDLEVAVSRLEARISEKTGQLVLWILGSMLLQIVGHFWH